MTKILQLLILGLVSTGCGSEGNPNVIPSLTGSSWTGIFSPSKGKNTNVSVNFFKDQSFKIAPLEQLSQTVNGTYTDMTKSRSLLLDVQQSQYSLIAEPKSSQDFSYEINEDELVLKGDVGDYLLVQRDETEKSDSQSKLLGDWSCSPKDGSTWGLNIATTNFRGHKIQAERRTIFFEGDVIDTINEKNKPEVFLMKVTRTNDYDKLIGIKLRITYVSNKKMKLEELDDKSKALSEIICGQQ